MFKNRHFMMGLGIGLIIGALLLQLMNLGQSQTGQLWTKQKIEDAAKELDLKVVENGTELLTEEEWKQKMESLDESGGLDGEPESSSNQGESQTKPVEETKKPATPEEPQTPQDKKVSSVNNESPVTTPSTEQPAAPAAPAKPKKVIVEYKIVSGSTLTGIAEGLEKSGVITDKEAFIKRAKDKKVNTKIRTGTYNFEIGEDFNSIITKLTAKPKY
ncbi:hypothetical protein SAMN04488542_101398 [Fontibacillus panacisegetis]|uniref:YceG-like family protein n=1 Tax=Fontibacillus panacisegetis TaxID=670482 RepID=A0A1G7EZM0_9BACL|nr:hypothetical protein [Fontibacillus panacisegetis]SDE68916.1 hypothetical protein SAMN04488542_101398 [Fontibacillus panacisegetis]